MLKKIAIALIAASVFAAPVLAKSGSSAGSTPARIAAPATPAKVAPVKVTKHIKRHKRHQGRHYAKVRGGAKHVTTIRHGNKSVRQGAGRVVQAPAKSATRSAN